MRSNLLAIIFATFAFCLVPALQAATMKDVAEAVKNQDFKKAFEDLNVLSAQGHAEAQFLLGLMYSNGRGTEIDYNKAFELLSKSADQGIANAQLALAGMYRDGKGTEQNFAKSVEWLRKAADQGHAAAFYNLGLRYAKGEGVEQNLEKAFELYSKAADLNNAFGQFNTAYAYAVGEGVEKNMVEALKWAQLSSELGFQRATLFVAFLSEKMTEEEVQQAMNLAVEWKTAKGIASKPAASDTAAKSQ